MEDGYQVVNGEYVDLLNAESYWDTAIGLRQVDNLTPSHKLYELVNEHLEGKRIIMMLKKTFINTTRIF